MTDKRARSAAPVAIAALLAAVAGFLDAYNFTGLTGTFIANQTGNTVLVGIALADGEASDVWPALVAIVSFTVGGALTAFAGWENAREDNVLLLAFEAALLVGFAVVALPAAENGDGRASGWTLCVLVAFGATAMGIQTSAVLRVWSQPVSTTFTSAMLHDAGQLAAELARRRVEHSSRRRWGLVVLGVAVVVYAAGAALGTLAARGAAVWLFVPAVVILFVGVSEATSRSPPSRGRSAGESAVTPLPQPQERSE